MSRPFGKRYSMPFSSTTLSAATAPTNWTLLDRTVCEFGA
jgi:hypothetical protein